MDDRLDRYTEELEEKNDIFEKDLKPKKFTKKEAETLREMIRNEH